MEIAVGLVDKVKGFFQSGKLDVASRYELEKHAFSGTMSKFRVARDFKTGQRVGLKLLDQEKTQAFENRFKGLHKPSEGKIGVKVKHPRVVETYDYGLTTENISYITMQYIHGPGLGSVIQDQDPRLETSSLNFIRQMAEAIGAVHKAGFIHRDICPRNFICDEDIENVTLIDFGLSIPDTPPFRQPGNRTGTPIYMAPEIVRRRETDKRVDIFALGVTIYRLLTFQHPWPGEDITGKAALAHDTVAAVDILKLRPSLDKYLAEAIRSCIAPRPDDRPDSAERFLQMIRKTERLEDSG